jgi:TrmH family RNA methyltransferase
MGIFRQPRHDADITAPERELCLALDSVQDPGNLGTIIRIADWFGIENIFCSQGTVDAYSPKTVQATMGAIGRVKVHYVDLPSFIETIKERAPLYGTFLDGDDIYGKKLENRGLVIMGNEGNGISEECRKHITEKLFIPNYPVGRETSESLNVSVATAIICSEFRRRI